MCDKIIVLLSVLIFTGLGFQVLWMLSIFKRHQFDTSDTGMCFFPNWCYPLGNLKLLALSA